MVDGLLDTTIIVDLLRQYPPAAAWVGQQHSLSTTPLIWLEIIEGANNKAEQTRALMLLRRFELIYLTSADFDWAIQKSAQFKLSHNTGMIDCLIAAVNQRLQVPLYTANLKHFAPLLGVLAQKPY